MTIAFQVNGQKNLSFEEIEKLDRISIIKLAKEQLNDYLTQQKENNFNYSFIDTIRIFKNKKNKYLVRFGRKVTFAPMNSHFCYGFDVYLLDKEIRRIYISNLEPQNAPLIFHTYTASDSLKINFVRKSIPFEKKDLITIVENDTHFSICFESAEEKLDKTSGKIYDFYEEFLDYNQPDMFNEVKTK